MKSFFKTLLFSLSGLWLCSCIIQNNLESGGSYHVEQKDSCGFAINRFNSSMKWDRSNFPIVFYIHESVPSMAHRNFISAVAHWNMAWEGFLEDKGLEPFPLFSLASAQTQYSGSPGNDSYNLLFFTDKFSLYSSPGDARKITQAITSTFSNSSGYLRDTDIIVNVDKRISYFFDKSYDKEIQLAQKEFAQNRSLASSTAPSLSFWRRLARQIQSWGGFLRIFIKTKKIKRQIASPYGNVPSGDIDFASLMIHELGHVPGLGHVAEHGTISSISGPMDSRQAKAGALENKKSFFSLFFSGEKKSRAPASYERQGKVISVMHPELRHGRSRRTVMEYDLQNLFCGYFGY